jgi:hypothetical protein
MTVPDAFVSIGARSLQPVIDSNKSILGIDPKFHFLKTLNATYVELRKIYNIFSYFYKENIFENYIFDIELLFQFLH